ncbi:MAG: AmmeMemoRadiSam system protein A, partial [Lachnospiraceae bacterium]|nr:AmmeMemoRadiSam system protein A [Lachnospiraceae bacterium]
MAVVGAVMVPHPPLILPEVGRGAEKEIAETARAYEAAADFAASLEPETVV